MKIGIIGGGQLARMILLDCHKFGFEFCILSNEKNSPAGQVTNNEIIGDWNDDEVLKTFGESCDVITLENEFIDHKKLVLLEEAGKVVYPGSKIIKLIQDKLFQKEFLGKLNIPVSGFCRVETKDDVIKFAEENNYPVILKSRTMGYDGKGNYEIKDQSDIDIAFDTLSARGRLLCESFVNFDKEIATQVVRSVSGEVKVYPVVETIQKDHICNLVLASGSNFANIKADVEKIAIDIVSELNYTGVMGIEMFLTGDSIIVNELAPRVHNSGHYTIEGCYTSQFENHIRAILDLPLGSVEMKNDHNVMINIIGDRKGRAVLKGVEKVLSQEDTYLHIYGKEETKTGRKMGHITVTGRNLKESIEAAYSARENISV